MEYLEIQSLDLFFININDLPSAFNFESAVFANDTNLHLFHHCLNTPISRSTSIEQI